MRASGSRLVQHSITVAIGDSAVAGAMPFNRATARRTSVPRLCQVSSTGRGILPSQDRCSTTTLANVIPKLNTSTAVVYLLCSSGERLEDTPLTASGARKNSTDGVVPANLPLLSANSQLPKSPSLNIGRQRGRTTTKILSGLMSQWTHGRRRECMYASPSSTSIAKSCNDSREKSSPSFRSFLKN